MQRAGNARRRLWVSRRSQRPRRPCYKMASGHGPTMGGACSAGRGKRPRPLASGTSGSWMSLSDARRCRLPSAGLSVSSSARTAASRPWMATDAPGGTCAGGSEHPSAQGVKALENRGAFLWRSGSACAAVRAATQRAGEGEARGGRGLSAPVERTPSGRAVQCVAARRGGRQRVCGAEAPGFSVENEAEKGKSFTVKDL